MMLPKYVKERSRCPLLGPIMVLSVAVSLPLSVLTGYAFSNSSNHRIPQRASIITQVSIVLSPWNVSVGGNVLVATVRLGLSYLTCNV
jgi:hypothetical protein